MFFSALSNSAGPPILHLPIFSSGLRWFAQDCLLCGALSGDRAVCAPCEAALPHAASIVARDPAVDAVAAAFDYRFPVDRLVQRFKFGADLAAGKWLALRLAERVRKLDRPDVLIAVPLGAARLRSRGFNQALEAAKVVGVELGIRVTVRGVERSRETAPQQSLGRGDRRANVRGAFRCARDLSGAHVAIVDDVVTTGSTIGALAEVLKGAGARRVGAWALARTPDPSD